MLRAEQRGAGRGLTYVTRVAEPEEEARAEQCRAQDKLGSHDFVTPL
jgi:hypothetical protein